MSDSLPLQSVSEPAPGYNDLKYYFANLNALFSIRGMLAVDMMTAMPPGGLQRRLNDISSLTKRIYAETTTASVTGLLERVRQQAEQDPSAWSAWDLSNLKEMSRIHAHLAALPPEMYHATVMTANEGRKRHAAALKNGKWDDTIPLIEQSVELYRRISALKQKIFNTATPYEALLRGYADDLNEAQVDALYVSLIPSLKSLHEKARARQDNQPPPLQLDGDFSRGDQMWLNKTVLQMIGFDESRGALSVTNLSPMASGTVDDVRVLVRCNAQYSFLDSLGDTLYHGARGLYIQGLPQNWKSQPVGQEPGSLITTAISILYETIIGRTPQFFNFISVRAEGLFKSFQDKSFETENLYRLKKRLNATPLRNEADELSKNFHNILRYGIERDLINGTLSVKDLPERWMSDSKALLGIAPKTLAEGPLQNPDWFTGRFGFIATNTLSHCIAAQLHEWLYASIGDLPGAIERGEFGRIRDALSQHVFSKGRAVDALDLLRGTTGEALSAQPLIDHLERRYLSDKR